MPQTFAAADAVELAVVERSGFVESRHAGIALVLAADGTIAEKLGDPSRWNPEDMLLSALSECHLLSYLHACVQAGVVVVGYEDEASGLMVEDGRGGGAFREVVLRPRVTVADPSMTDAATAAHAQAREWCFIANSVNFPVRHEPTVLVASS